MKHRFTPIVVTAGGLAIAMALTGCGRTDTPDPGATAGAAIDDSPATGTIDVWAMGTEGELLPELVKGFEEANPDVTVTVTAVPWQDYATKLQTAIASGSTPDVTMLGSSDTAGFAATGGLEVVPEGLVDTDGFFPGAVSAAEYNGASYAVPWYVETRSLFYRKDLAEAAGVEAPTTWDEFRTFAKALQGQGAEWGFSTPTGAPGTWQGVLPYIWQAGGEVFDADADAFTFDTPESLEGFKYYQSLITDGIADSNGPTNLGEVEPKFVSGEVGSFVSGPWEIGLLKQAGGQEFIDKSVGLVTLPAGSDSNTGYIGGGHFAVFKDSDNRDASWKLIKWLSEESTQQDWYKLSGDLPALQSAWSGDAFQNNDVLSVFQAQLETAQAAPGVTTWNQVSTVIDAEAEKVAKGVSTPADAVKALQAEAEKIGTGE
jgi:multiple sugar transport system substrate-binding protein